MSIKIDDAGAISGTYLGCALSGTSEPSSSYGYFKVAFKLLGSCEAEILAPFSGFLVALKLDRGRTQLLLYGSASWDDGWSGAAIFASGAR